MGGKWIVVDTNTLIDFALFPRSFGFQAVERMLADGWELCFSKDTFGEFAEVLLREKFSRFLSMEDREIVLENIRDISTFYEVTQNIVVCRDPKDDKFLELALSAGADLIVSRDQDLLVLNPFEGIPIVEAQDFVEKYND